MAFVIDTEQSIEDLSAIRHVVEGLAQAIYDSITYLGAVSVSVELASIFEFSTGRLYSFLAADPELVDPDVIRNPHDIIQLASEVQTIRRVFRDLHSAMIVADDTAFYCFRAVEAIIQAMKKPGEGDSQARARLRSALNVDQQYIDKLAGTATPARHAKVKMPLMPRSARIDLMKRARSIVDRYIVYLLSGEQSLPHDQYPLLKR